jgi:hypothetical protein
MIWLTKGGFCYESQEYMFGFLTLHYNFGFLWMLLNMIADRMVSFPIMLVVTAIIAAGLMMVVNPPLRATEKAVVAVLPANT